MAAGLCAPAPRREHPGQDEILASTVRCPRHFSRSTFMQWQTPAATDLRFGFEITMYVANR